MSKNSALKQIDFNRLSIITYRVVFLLLFTPASSLWAQGFFVSINSSTGVPDAGNTGSFSFSICDGDPTDAWFTVDWNAAASGATNARIEITLPTGFDYVDGSLDNISAPLGPTGAMESGGVITLPMADMMSGDGGSFRFRLNMDCSTIAFLMSNQATLRLDAFSDEGNTNHTTGSFSNTIGIPNLVNNLSNNTNVTYNSGVVGTAFTRSFAILQNGLNAASLEEFEICMTYGSGLTVNSIELVQGATTAAVILTGGCVTINSANFPTLTFPLGSGEELLWQESISPNACDNLDSRADWSWGCNASDCQSGFLTFGTSLENNSPSFSVNSITRTINGCIEDGADVEVSYELNGLAFDLGFLLNANAGNTYIDNSVAVQIDTGLGYFTYVGGMNNVSNTSHCSGSQTLSYRTDPFSGPFDARSASRTFRVRYRVRTCCPSGSCNTSTRTILGVSPDIFADDMCGNSTTRSADVDGISMRASTSDLVPAYIADAEIATWVYNLNNIPTLSELNNAGQVCMDFSIDAPLQYQAGSIEWVDALGVNPLSPSGSTLLTIETITTTGSGTDVYVCFDVGDNHGDGSQIRFNALYSCTVAFCSAVVDTDMKIGYRFGDGTCTDDCIFPIACETGQTTLGDGCCPGICDGMSNLYTTVQRNCFGLPDSDNDGCEDTGGSIDLSLVALDRAMEGDELLMTTASRVNLTDPLDSFKYIFFDMTFPNAHEIGSQQSLTIYDASAFTYYTCDQLNVFVINSTTIRYYLTTDFLNGCGDIPADFAFRNGDSLLLSSTFVNLNNPGCLVEQVNIGADWYTVRNGDPDGDPHLTCNLPIPGAYSQVGYSLTVTPQGQNSYGCVGARFRYRATFCIGGGDYRIQPFPYEIRNFMLPEQSGLLIPEGLELESLLLSNIQFTRYFNENYLSESEDVTALAKQVGDYVILDWADYFEDCTNNHQPNGGYRFDIEGRFQGTCASGPSQAEWYYQADMDYCSPAATDETVRVDGTHSGTLPVTVPNLSATTSQNLIQPFDAIASWTFNIEETVGANADNTWAIFVSPSGGIIPTQLSSGGAIAPTDGVYSLGDYSSGEDNNYQLDVNYTTCTLDSIFVIYGWDCAGIPISDQQVIQGGLPCPVDTLVLYLTPISGNIQQQVLMGPTSVLPCSDFSYEIEIKNVGVPTIYEPEFEIFLPYTSGMVIDPISPEICYPCEASNPVVYNYPTVSPTEIIITPLGIKHIWNLETIVGVFDATATSPTGWFGESQTTESNKRLRIRFNASTTCDFIGGDYINFKTIARTWCGKDVRSSLQNSAPVVYDIPDPAFSGAINLNIDSPIDGCQIGEEVTLSGNLFLFGPAGLGLTTTDGNDTLVVALPAALSFSSVAFNPAHVSNTTPIINIIGPGVGTSSFQELRWGIDAGVALGSSIPFEIKTVLDPTQILCEDDNAVFMRSVRAANFTCGADPCATSVTTASKVEIIDFELNLLSVYEFDVEASCGMTSLDIINLTLENRGTFPVTEDVTIDFYYDADDSGHFSTGDVLVGSQIYTDDIPVGVSAALSAGPFTTTADQTCKLIAFVSGCNCETIATTANSFRTNNAGADVLGCSSDDFVLGCGEDNTALGFSYQWFGLNGAPIDSLVDATDPNTTLNYTHFNGSDITLEYILLTTHPGGTCVSVDTVAMTLKGVDIATGPLLKVCPDSLLAFSGPTGFFNYQWSPTNNVTDVIHPQSTVAAPVGIQTYTLTYNDLGGCEQYFQQTVSGVNCTDLELLKEVDVNTANIGDIVTYNVRVINQGPNGASGVEVADTLPVQLTYLSSVPAGEYDNATSIWTIPGVLLPGDTVRLTIYAQIVSGGPVYNVAEISNMIQGDVDSTPNNDDDSEDDQEGVCTSAPIDIACRETKAIGIPDEFASYQWYKDNVLIVGATHYNIDITESGSYRVEVNGGDCPYNNCCPFEVVEESCANIGNYVFQDLDGNGTQDTGEGGIENVMVILYNASTGIPIDTVFTDASGNYLFEELPSGNYNLTFDASTNTSGVTYTATTQNANGDDATDSDVNPTDGTTGPFMFDASTGDDLTWDAGYSTFADIGDYVWVDLDQDGLQEFIEPALENVTVTLYDAITGLAVRTDFTDTDGEYLFTDVPHGSYYIEFDLSSVVGSQVYEFTTAETGDGTNDSEVDPVSNVTPIFVFDPLSGDDLTHDAGVVPTANIGDLVWVDTNADGVYDAGTESGLDSVLVILYDSNTGLPLDSVFTDASGNYLFANVASGEYYIDFDFTTSSGQDFVWTEMDATAATDATDSDVNTSNGQTNAFTLNATTGDDLTIDAGVIPVADLGDFVWNDSDQDGIQDPNEVGIENVRIILYDETGMMPLDTVFTDMNGAYLFPDLPAGNYSLIFDPTTNATGDDYSFTSQNNGTTSNDSDPDPTTGQTTAFLFDPINGDDLTIDAGLYQIANIGNYVWVDADMDGIQDPLEAGLDSVLVILYDAGSGLAIDSVWTGSIGEYLFEAVSGGDYYIGFEPNASFGNENYDFSSQFTGNGANDSDADTNGFTSVINFDPSSGDNLTIDAGVSPIANIGDFVWIDTNGDGIQNGSEIGIENVSVILYDNNTGLSIDTVLTDMNGNYLFENIPSGDYYLAFDPSTSTLGADYRFAIQGAGTTATDNDANSSGQSPVFTFDASMGDKMTCDAGLLPTPVIATVKAITESNTLSNGHIDISFELGLKNTGPVDVTNISLVDNLQTQLGIAFVGMSGASPNLSILSSTATSTPTLNTLMYNGSTNDDVFVGAPTDLLEPGQEITLMLIAEIDPLLAAWPLMNQTLAQADGLDENGDALTVGGLPVRATDQSDSGRNFDSTNPGEPGDNGTSDDPTEITCTSANVIITGEPTGVCPGDDVALQVTSIIPGATYEWRVVGTSTVVSTNANPTFTGLNATTAYEVTAINATSLCIYDLLDTTSITVFTAPTAVPTANYTLNPDCSPADLTLMSTVTTGSAAIVDYSWTGPNGFTSSVQNPVIPNATSTNNGSYTLVATDANGCSVQENIQISTIADPQAQPIITGTGPACIGESIMLSAPQYTGATVTYTWTTPSGTNTGISGVGTNEIIISPIDNTIHPGTYSLAINVDGCALSANYNVVTFAAPTAAVNYVTTDTCNGGTIQIEGTGTGTGTLSYLWAGPNGFSSTLQNISISGADESYNGLYTLIVNSASGCSASASTTVDNIQLPGEVPSVDVNNSICQGDTIHLSTSTDGDLFEWIQNSDSQGSLALPGMTTTVNNTTIPPDHPLYENGPWRVRVTSDNACTEESVAVNVVINEVPVALADNSGPICENAVVQLLSNTVTGAIYRWYDNDPDGVPAGNLVSMEQNPSLNNLASGTHEFYLTIENNGCPSTVSMTTITINAEPTLAPTASYVLASNCAPSDLTLNANAVGVGLTYTWTGPNNFSSAIENPTIPNATEANNGSYTLMITDASGCVASESVEIVSIINAEPMPIITHNGPECDGDEVILTVPQYQGAAVDYVWTTPSGTIVNIAGLNTNEIVISPLDVMTHEGEYSVEITIDGCILNSDTFDLDVNMMPTLAPMATSGTICEGTTIDFTANDANVINYNWTGPNGFTSTAQNPQIANVATAQNGTYTLIVTTDRGCTATESIVVNNIVLTPITPSITSNQPLCFDEVIELNIQEQYTGTTLSYNWTNGAGTTIGTTSALSIDADDANAIPPYRVSITVDGCTSDLSPATLVEVNTLPNAIATNAGTICPGETAQLFANEIAGANYQWTISGSTTVISTTQNPSFSDLTATTTYELTVISNGGCISNPLSQTTVVVNTEPSVSPSANYLLNTDCSASDLSLSANAVAGSGVIETYNWIGPNNFSSAQINPTIPSATEVANGSYVLTIIDANGCSTSGSVEVTNITNTVAQPIVNSTGPACEGEEVVLNVDNYSGSSVDYVWTTPSGTIVNITGLNTNELVINPLDAMTHEGEYYVTVSVDGCVLQSDTMQVDVFTQPTANPNSTAMAMCEGDLLTLTADAIDAVSYNWSGPNGFSSTAENPELANVSVANNGIYTLTIQGEGNCVTTESLVVNNIQVTPQIPTISTNSPQCTDGMISLSIQEQYIGTSVSYEWTNGSGIVIGSTSSISISPTAATSISPYRVNVTVDGCTSPLAAPQEVIVNALPASIATNGGSICPGEVASLFANPIAGATYEWRDISTGVIVATSQNHTLSNLSSTTTYELTVISNGGCISNPLSQTTVVVNTESNVSPGANYTLNTDCSASDLSLSANVVAGSGVIETYNWIGPNNFSSAQINPTIPNATEAANGSYILTIVDANGCNTSGSVEVTNITNTVAQPIVNSSGPACEGEMVVLDIAAYSGSNVTYTWMTPDGTTTNITGLNTNQIVISPLTEATHEGAYAVMISVDGCVLESTTMQVDIFDTPTAMPMATSMPICLDGALTLEANATGVGPLTYNWSGPNGFNSGSENPSLTNVTVAANGQYTITVTSTSGCTIVESMMVSDILPAPELPNLVAEAAICEGEDFVLTTSASGILYEWIGPLGSSASTLTKPGLTTTVNSTTLPLSNEAYLAGSWSVRVTDVNGCTSISPAVEVSINEIPLAQAFNDGSICAESQVQLEATTIEGATYEWRIAGSPTIVSTLQNPIVTDLQATTTYELTVINNACISDPLGVTTVVVNETPMVEPSASYDLSADCSPSDLFLFANVMSSGTINTFEWIGPNGYSSAVEHPEIPFATEDHNGSYTLTVTDENGCSNSASFEVVGIVNDLAQPVITSSGPACEGETIVLSIPAYNGANVDYHWTLPSNVNITGQNSNQITISPADATIHEGIYSVFVQVNECELNSDFFVVDVFEMPTIAPEATAVDMCEGEMLTFAANANNALNYYWTGPNGFISTAENPALANITVNNNGTYTLQVTSESGCIVTESIVVNNIVLTPQMPTITASTPVCENDLIFLNIQEQYLGTDVTYNWTNGAGTSFAFGNGATIAANAPNAISPYRVSVMIDGCTSPVSLPVEVEVSALPTASASNDGFICQGGNIQLLAGPVENAVYEWRVAGSTTLISTNQNPTIYNLTSTTTYELSVISDNGCFSNPVATTTVVVNTPPSLLPAHSYTINPDCSPSDLALLPNITSGTGAVVAYQWTGPNGFTSTLANPTIPDATETNNGSYTLEIIDEFGCSAIGSVQVTGISNQVAQPIISSSGPTCEGTQVVINVPQYLGAAVDYQWNVPSTANITGLNTNQIVISPVDAAIHEGTYSVTVMVDDCTISSDTYVLEIFEQPIIAPTATTVDLCEDGLLNLMANVSTTLNGLNYEWTGPNGFTSNAANPQIANVSVANNGTYTLTVTTISGCTTTESIVVNNVNQQPTQPLILADTEVCINETIALTIQQTYTGNLIAYNWYNAEGTIIGNGSSVSIAANDPAAISPYAVTVEIDGCLAEQSEAIHITITELPEATALNNGPICIGSAVQLMGGEIPGGQYFWYSGNPQASPPGMLISTDQNPILFDLTEGIHPFYLVVETNECASSAIALTTVEVNAQPMISGISGSGSYCQGSTITLTAINTIPTNGNMVYTWVGPNGFSYSATTGWDGPFTLVLPNASPDVEGSYTLSLTTEAGCTADVQSVNIDLDATPMTPNLAISSDLLCEGELLELNSTTFTGTPVVYEWFFEDENGVIASLGTTDLPTFFVDNVSGLNAGIYTVQVTVDACVSQPSNAQDVLVFGNVSPPQAANTTTASTPACEGSAVNLSIPVIVGATYQWFGPNGFNSSLANPVISNISLNDAGEYYAIVELNGCASVISIATQVFVQKIMERPTIVNNGPWCEGGDVVLNVSSPLNLPPGVNVTFDWYFTAGNVLIGSTTIPEITMTGLNASNSGDYYMIMTVGDCATPSSSFTAVQIDAVPANEADAGADVSICASTIIELDAEQPSIGTGFWTSPTGATISNPEQPHAAAIDLVEGNNMFIWTLSNGACENYDADTVMITVSLNPVDIAFAGNDFDICGNTNVNLQAAVPQLAGGIWSQTQPQASLGVIIVDPTNPNTAIEGLVIGNEYRFTWTLSQGVCEAFAKDEVIVGVNEAPLLNAFVFESEIYSCGEMDQVISALEPSSGTGQWSTTTLGAVIVDPQESETIVDNLRTGENVFIWTLSNGACENYSSDTMTIYLEDELTANADHYELNFGDTLVGIELMDNDFIGNIEDWSFKLIEQPRSGTLELDESTGRANYLPNNGFFGEDQMIYEICNVHCTSVCDTALVTIRVKGTENTGDCWVPNIITPNNDGMNDQLIIPCLDTHPENELRVYNRWGDRVYLSTPYKNDWAATFKGELLPAGTYFYILKLSPDTEESLQGYFTIIR